jgi:hypothetical protein
MTLICMWLLTFAIVLLMAGCGTSRDSQTKTVEKLTTKTGPVLIDTPIGQFAMQAISHEMVRSETEVSTEQSRIDAPEAGQIITAVAGGTPWGGLITGVVGMGIAAFAGKKAMDMRRHRDQLIDGIESARDAIPDDVDEKVCAKLAAKQDADLQRVIQARTS